MFAKNNVTITLNFAYITMTTYASDVIYLLIFIVIISIIVISTKNYFIFYFRILQISRIPNS